MDVFSWSIPFVAEKVSELIFLILKFCDEDEEEQELDDKEKRRQQIRTKILFVGRFMRMYSTLRTERESILLLKGLSERNNLPRGLLTGGPGAIREAVGNFMKVKAADKSNEKRPNSPLPPLQRTDSQRLKGLQRKLSEKSMLVGLSTLPTPPAS